MKWGPAIAVGVTAVLTPWVTPGKAQSQRWIMADYRRSGAPGEISTWQYQQLQSMMGRRDGDVLNFLGMPYCDYPHKAFVYLLRDGRAVMAQFRDGYLTTTLEEELNGIDLANQAPLAALGTPAAYPEHLARAKQRGLTGQTAILTGHVWSFWDPTMRQWDDPGLGNSESNIRYDQHRRMQAIARALAVYQQQQGQAEQVANQIIDQEHVAL